MRGVLVMARRGRKRQLDAETSYWKLLQSGVGTVEACKMVGIGRKTGYRWRAENGGLPPGRLAEAARPGRLGEPPGRQAAVLRPPPVPRLAADAHHLAGLHRPHPPTAAASSTTSPHQAAASGPVSPSPTRPSSTTCVATSTRTQVPPEGQNSAAVDTCGWPTALVGIGRSAPGTLHGRGRERGSGHLRQHVGLPLWWMTPRKGLYRRLGSGFRGLLARW